MFYNLILKQTLSLFLENINNFNYNMKMAPRDGFEPPARRLTVVCSTAELPGINRLTLVIFIKCKYSKMQPFNLRDLLFRLFLAYN